MSDAVIAREPLPERDASRLLVLDRAAGTREHRVFRDLPDLLHPDDLLVVNRSRVFPARLLGRRSGGGQAEVLLVRHLGAQRWEALLRPAKRLRPGSRITVAEDFHVHVEQAIAGRDARRSVRLQVSGGDVEAALQRHGQTPLPPYLGRPSTEADKPRYQTVYARESGSVAAPTAGLHFSTSLLERLARRGLRRAEVVLHVGPGTFLPVTVSDVREHKVEAEAYAIPEETAAAIRRTRLAGGRVVAVGTTTTRALESAATAEGRVAAGRGSTDLVIVPGFSFRVVDVLITNFHLPRSSLLLLVSAFAGRRVVLDTYDDAFHRGYRAFSYGDAMLIL